MKVNLENYTVASKIFLGNNLKLILISTNGQDAKKVVELTEVVGFIEDKGTGRLSWLRIDDGNGSYNFDLSIRLQRPEIQTFNEVFLFVDDACVNFIFRAAAKSVSFRDWCENDKWLK
ncbi:hypothetical protein [Paracnuella aquatica]|uniref:hypothetical protein n=1 Tax=Paracnuella aquatica TaxID=2268757 RepID=UPI000DEEC9E4|nr:hypothetical protein [Paracnuella aquatica]RPD43434.1 hypothetical protein DRJ53_20215 [Paracnuella aquatica]